MELTGGLCGEELPISCTNRESKYSGAKSQPFCWALAEGGCDKHCKGKNTASEILVKAAAHHPWSHCQAAGSHSEGSVPCRTASPTGFGVAMGHGDVSAPTSPHWAPHSSGCWALQELGPGVQILELFTLWIRVQIWSELCSCGVCPKLKEMFILQNVLFCQWLIPVHPCCHSRHILSVQSTTKRNLCRKTSGICHRCNAE